MGVAGQLSGYVIIWQTFLAMACQILKFRISANRNCRRLLLLAVGLQVMGTASPEKPESQDGDG